MVLDVNGNRLDALYLDRYGAVLDRFTLIKGSPPVSAKTRQPSAEAAPAAAVAARNSRRVRDVMVSALSFPMPLKPGCAAG